MQNSDGQERDPVSCQLSVDIAIITSVKKNKLYLSIYCTSLDPSTELFTQYSAQQEVNDRSNVVLREHE